MNTEFKLELLQLEESITAISDKSVSVVGKKTLQRPELVLIIF